MIFSKQKSLKLLLSTASLVSGLTLATQAGFAENNGGNQKAPSSQTYPSSAALMGKARSVGQSDTKPASATLKSGLKALRKGRTKDALKARQSLKAGSLERKVMAWAIAVYGRDVDAQLLHKISLDLAHWPLSRSIRRNLEKALVDTDQAQTLRVAFQDSLPESDEAKIALAIAHNKAGATKSARKVIAPLWHEGRLTRSEENKILKSLGRVLSQSDHRARVEYLLSKKRLNGAKRLAGRAGMTRLVRARTAVERNQRSAKSSLSSVPAFQKESANYLFSRARMLRKANQPKNAAKVLLSIPTKSIHPQSADLHWTEHRIVASDLLKTSPNTAYRLASRNVARSVSKRIDAEFYAGWIALQKLGNPAQASRHFDSVLKLATTPISKSRGYYWKARAALKAGQKKTANSNFASAARFDTTFYGQLAAEKLGRRSIQVSKASPTKSDRTNFPKLEMVQAIAKLTSAGQHRMARPIYRFLARHLIKPGQLALLSAQAERQGDYQLGLQIGKIGFSRGMDVDTLSWPLGAIPRNTKTSGAGLPMAYAIARQESTFQIDARSSANALGLLQLLPGTAKRVARTTGVRYSRNRLVTDPAYNARLGTAYLNQQMKKFGGSLVLTFAAYNAGPGKAVDWIEEIGDPRGKSTEAVIDWIEQIPYKETRNYVQRVMENYQVYKTRIKGSKLSIGRDLRRG